MDLTGLITAGMDVSSAAGLLMNIMWTMLGAFLVYFMQASPCVRQDLQERRTQGTSS